jgi:hypothetical protein
MVPNKMCQGTQTLNVAQNLKPNDKTKLDFANGFNLDSQPSQSKRTYVHDFIIKDLSNGVVCFFIISRIPPHCNGSDMNLLVSKHPEIRITHRTSSHV